MRTEDNEVKKRQDIRQEQRTRYTNKEKQWKMIPTNIKLNQTDHFNRLR